MTTTEAPARRQLLDLSTLVPDRPFIRIDGKAFDLRVPEDFGLVGQAKVGRIMDRLGPLSARIADAPESISEDDVEEASRLLSEACALLVDAPAEVLDRLNDQQRLAVVSAFTQASETMKRPTPAPNRASRRTGARSSRASRPRTAPTTG